MVRRLIFIPLALAACGPTPPGPDDPGPPYTAGMVAEVYFKLDRLAHYYDAARASDPSGETLPDIEKDIEKAANANIHILLEHLQVGDVDRKVLSAFGLGFVETKKKSTIPVLARAMTDGAQSVRRMSAVSLGRLKPEDPPIDLYRRLLYDRTVEAREGSLLGLAFLLGEEAGQDYGLLPDIHDQLKHLDFRVRNQAVITLSVVRSYESVGPLCALLTREDKPHVRANTALTLERIGSKLPKPRVMKDSPLLKDINKSLIDLLKDYDTTVVDFAYHALVQINDVVLNRAHDSWRDWYESTLKHDPGTTPPGNGH